MRYITHWGMAAFAVLLLASCTTIQTAEHPSGIGPYTDFSGRLLVIQAAKRWQMEIDWHGSEKEGRARLTHAASNHIVEIQWHRQTMQLRDNQQQMSWQPLSNRQLQHLGIVIPPQQMAGLLTGKLPPNFRAHGDNHWEGTIRDSYLHITWRPEKQQLTILDVTHGNKLILLIES